MVRTILWLILVLLVTSASPMVVPQGGRGDPAPGRSPGPPTEEISSSEYYDSSTSEKNLEDEEVVGSVVAGNESAWCSTADVTQRVNSPLQFRLLHPKFSAEAGLVAGVYYQVAIKLTGSNNREVIETFVTAGTGEWSGETYLHQCAAGEGILGASGAVKLLAERVPLYWRLAESPPMNFNLTFRVAARTDDGHFLHNSASFPVIKDCSVRLASPSGSLTSTDLPEARGCSVTFPIDQTQTDPAKRRGLLLQLTRLNVPCQLGGAVELSTIGDDRPPRRLCGKLEELSARDRTFHFPAASSPTLRLLRSPVFALNYTSVDYCYNVTLTARNGSITLTPTNTLYCHFRVHLPYGNRVRLLLQVGEEPTTTVPSSSEVDTPGNPCDGLFVVVWNGASDWTHCSRQITPKPNVEVESVGNVVTVHVMATGADRYPTLRFWYSDVPVPEVVGACQFGEVAVRKYCAYAVQATLPWSDAETHCAQAGGHLLSIRDENAQNIVDRLLLQSPQSEDHDSYWIGASDLAYEGHYQWSDGHAFSYSNWFPGWQQHGFYNRQPNDDGLSRQDCVEVRRSFPAPLAGGIGVAIAPSYLWNDLDCSTPNFFLCERVRSEDSMEDSWRSECNRTITLTREHPRSVATSPGFPYHYPDNVRCLTTVVAPNGYHIVLDFEELVLEKEPMCSYDYLEIVEMSENSSYAPRRTSYCGDMSDKLKLLRYASESSVLHLLFVSDYSHHFGGFKARVSIENARKDCADDNHKMFNNFCYLFVGYPKVTWQTAQQICSGMKAQLASVSSAEEQAFVTSNLRNSMDYSTTSVFWLGGYVSPMGQWLWADDEPFEFSAWPPNESIDNAIHSEPVPSCLGLQWVSSGPGLSGLYWAPKECRTVGGYICKKPVAGGPTDLSKTINGSDGFLTSPGHPSPYRPDLDYEVRLIGPAWTRMVISLTRLDMEQQADCLYDFLELRSGGALDPEQRWCGSWNTKIHPFNFVSSDNEAYIRFRSDYSVSGSGFAATWRAVDVAGCPSQTLTAREGILSSPNYPEFVLPGLNCVTTVLAAPGKRIWLEFTEMDLGEDAGSMLELDLGGAQPFIRPGWTNGSIGGGNFVSLGEKLVVHFNTSLKATGAGFRAIYRSVNSVHEERIVDLTSDTFGVLHHLNYPAPPPRFADFLQNFVAPLGYIIILEFHKVVISEQGPSCPGGRGVIEVNDNYADVNGTWWFLCPVDDLDMQRSLTPTPPIAITSYLHTLHVRQRSLSVGLRLNATLRVKEDPQFKLKILRLPDDSSVETCRPNPCLNGGKCLNSAVRKTCQCSSHFTGLFCALTQCELEPCLFGVCELTTTGYHCRCQAGYTGHACEMKQRPCADNPCEGRGECHERGDAFHCQCHAWWEGPRCERKMMHIPYKPLSERMLQEPFWLGLITVFVVLGVIGLFWCAKRHFPEKLEKLLAEEADRHNRSHCSASGRPPSARDLGSASVALQSPTAPPCPRTLFGRLGIRKPSLLSLTGSSPMPAAAPRTFSLDDLLRHSPRRSPSPRKKRTNSTPTNPSSKNAAEKKQILQQLISPSTSATPPNKASELLQLKEKKPKSENLSKELKVKETSFTAQDPTSEDRLEKKVTFARLLSKVSAEMSSGSEMEASKPPLARAVSTPASPAANRVGRISRQGESLSSSEVTISAGTSTLDIPNTAKRPNRLNCTSNRNPSADSLLAMFRNLGNASDSNAPSPLDDSFYSDESLAVDTPVSTSSGPSDSPGYGVTIEIPVMDALTAQKAGHSNLLQPPSIHLELPSGGVNKCLSPIREVPTPMSSPALTPIMPRTGHVSKEKIESSEEEKAPDDDTDEFTEGSSELVVEIHHEADSDSAQNAPPTLVIPLLVVEEPSPKVENKTMPAFTFSGSPPPQKRESFCIQTPRSPPKKLLKELEKPTSLDLPHPPPMIMVTCNASEGESDTESSKQAKTHNPTVNSAGMNYLSPFSMCSRGDRTASESNLSSSGYSSMASPGPSRCGSNNPLCLSEVEDHGPHSQPPSRRPSPLLSSPGTEPELHRRRRSDSETLSDDPLIESNDEGIGTDHLEEKTEENGSKMNGCQNFFDFSAIIPTPPPRGLLKKCDNVDTLNPPLSKSSLQLPTIVVQSDFCDKMLSPVSSRSESPLSDKTLGLGRFSPMFYCKNKSDQLPFTDSDGLYDFPSSDCPPSKHRSVQACTAPHRKRRDRRAASKSPSPTKGLAASGDTSPKDTTCRPAPPPRKPSPKRRSRSQAPPSSSSSTESLTFGKGNVSIRLTSPDGTEWPVRKARGAKMSLPASNEASAEDTGEEVTDGMASSHEDLTRPQRNLSRLRSIAHQIRFLRRIELSLRRKERLISQSDSGGEGGEEQGESSATALLPRTLRPAIMPVQEMRKSSSNGVLCTTKRQRGSKKRGSPLLPRPYSAIPISHGQTD